MRLSLNSRVNPSKNLFYTVLSYLENTVLHVGFLRLP
jgi:hypothetical protein